MSVRRLWLLQGAALVLALAVALQLVRLQFVDAAKYRLQASDERMRVIEVEPSRGRILDRRGVPVAVNVPRYSVRLVPNDVPKDEAGRRDALLRLERELSMPLPELERVLAAGLASVDPLSPVTVQEGLERERAIALRTALASAPGVLVEAAPLREYGGGGLLARVLGHVAPIEPADVDRYLDSGYPLNARVGQSGVELAYETDLRGGPGRRIVVANPAGKPVATLGELPATPGADLVLSLDLELQRQVEAALARGIIAGVLATNFAKWHNPDSPREAGAAVLLDVRSGELLALVSLPTFEANLLGTARDDDALASLIANPSRPLVDRAYMDVRAPGSIFKPIVAAAALQEGVAGPGTLITSTGAISVQDRYTPGVTYVFRDWAAHGTLDLYGGIARSSDVYFYYLAGGYAEAGQQQFEGLGPERVARYARAAGLGAPTGLDLPGEASGLVPDPDWKEAVIGDPWVLGDTYTYGIGQGYLAVTPLQMAVAAAAIANDGDVLVPRVVRALRQGDVETLTPRRVRERLPVEPGYLDVVRVAMRLAADAGGTATTGEPAGMQIGGKTGTAEFGRMAPDGSYDSHAWFIGFAPYSDPEVAVAVYLEHGVGATHAGPVAREIFEAYFAARAHVARPQGAR